MRKIAVLLTLLMLTLLMLTATLFFVCSEINNGTSIESETEEPQSEEVSSEILNSEESSKEELSSEASSEAVSSEEEDKPRLNEDLLSDIGLSFSQIRKKRGRLTKVETKEGGINYTFEHGLGEYAWEFSNSKDWLNADTQWPIDKKGNIIVKSAPIPKEHHKCLVIDHVNVEDLFLGAVKSIKATEIEKIYDVNYQKTVENGGWEGWDFSSVFFHGNIRIGIATEKKGLIDLDSRVRISEIG